MGEIKLAVNSGSRNRNNGGWSCEAPVIKTPPKDQSHNHNGWSCEEPVVRTPLNEQSGRPKSRAKTPVNDKLGLSAVAATTKKGPVRAKTPLNEKPGRTKSAAAATTKKKRGDEWSCQELSTTTKKKRGVSRRRKLNAPAASEHDVTTSDVRDDDGTGLRDEWHQTSREMATFGTYDTWDCSFITQDMEEPPRPGVIPTNFWDALGNRIFICGRPHVSTTAATAIPSVYALGSVQKSPSVAVPSKQPPSPDMDDNPATCGSVFHTATCGSVFHKSTTAATAIPTVYALGSVQKSPSVAVPSEKTPSPDTDDNPATCGSEWLQGTICGAQSGRPVDSPRAAENELLEMGAQENDSVKLNEYKDEKSIAEKSVSTASRRLSIPMPKARVKSFRKAKSAVSPPKEPAVSPSEEPSEQRDDENSIAGRSVSKSLSIPMPKTRVKSFRKAKSDASPPKESVASPTEEPSEQRDDEISIAEKSVSTVSKLLSIPKIKSLRASAKSAASPKEPAASPLGAWMGGPSEQVTVEVTLDHYDAVKKWNQDVAVMGDEIAQLEEEKQALLSNCKDSKVTVTEKDEEVARLKELVVSVTQANSELQQAIQEQRKQIEDEQAMREKALLEKVR